MEITESSTGKLNWKGFSDERDDLILWLDRPYHAIPTITNIEYIRTEWNTLNVDNSNVRQIIIPKEKEEVEDGIIYKKSMKKGKNSRLL